MADAPQKITVGTSWFAGGRTWEVYQLLPFGRVRVRTTDGHRVGEMYYRDLRAALALASQVSA